MKIKINQIVDDTYLVRDEIDMDHLDEVTISLKNDGQWNPIIVRPGKKGMYELISGHYRVQAAKKNGWKEIEATVQDLDDFEANLLSLKTNVKRINMTEMEEGKVLQLIIQKYNISQTQLAELIGKKENWVHRRIILVMKVIKEVQDALATNKISMDHANIISQINSDLFDDWEEQQREFLTLVLKNKWTRDETRRQLKRYFNTTVYTIGYEGRAIDEFIDVLKKNDISILLDVRFSAESQYKPEFNSKVLERTLKQNGIQYEHHPELGIPYIIQNPYKDGDLEFKCLNQWYRWHIKNEVKFNEIIEIIKDTGRPVIMCMERYAMENKKQPIHCHRHILANLIIETMLFQKRVDL